MIDMIVSLPVVRMCVYKLKFIDIASSHRNKDLFRKFEDKFTSKHVNGANKPSILDRIKKHDSEGSKSREKHKNETVSRKHRDDNKTVQKSSSKYEQNHSTVKKNKREAKEQSKKYSSKDFLNVEEEDIDSRGYGADDRSTKMHISKLGP